MQTINLQIEDSFSPHFKVMIESFVKDKKVHIMDSGCDYTDNYPNSVVVDSIDEVRRRVYEAEQEDSVSNEKYNIMMSKFFPPSKLLVGNE